MGGLVDYYVACSKDNQKQYETYQTTVQNLTSDIELIQGYAEGKVILELFVHNDNGRLTVSNDPGKKYVSQ